ncbi:PPC domain-containing DNA-binding protein [Desulfurispora thermophila]|uniref:PPC domain-containing DNA-binding protein n=1 Tax=Desulfurispora thermophila TaxID=265470 RepID=UPI000365E9D0|nr:PPC domain-containing DNA-binding protein [Desulfurispora thermophila]
MQYSQGAAGRFFVVRVEHGEDLLQAVKDLARRENIRQAVFWAIGALGQARLVVGPGEAVLPPEPVWREVNEPGEILATGNIFWDEHEPIIHLHASWCRGDTVLTGCVREKATVYLMAEVFVWELAGLEAARQFDQRLGLKALSLPAGKS